MDSKKIWYLGECYVKLELAKRDFRVSGVDMGFNFDMLGQNGAVMEVKTALPSKNRAFKRGKWYIYKNWQFRLDKKQIERVDFVVCVILEDKGEEPVCYFMFPIEHIKKYKKSNHWTVFESDIKGEFKTKKKRDLQKYKNNWDMLINFKNK